MTAGALAPWMLEQEARALLTRLARVKPFALQDTMVPAAALSPAAQTSIERYLVTGRRHLRDQVLHYIRWLRSEGRSASPVEMQRRFTFLRLRFNTVLSQLDLFSEAVSQRSEHEIGVWLSGLDVAAAESLTLAGGYFDAPPIVCLLHRGLGGAIRRARTRLPGGGANPASIIRIPRERMIGYGIASSLMHEVGHQGAALLGLVESLRPVLQDMRRTRGPEERVGWGLWERWISEIIADFWSIAKVGIASTLGLVGLVSLPRAFVFRVNTEDPHPFPWIRVVLSCAMGNALYPHPQWKNVAAVWESFYPPAGLDAHRQGVLASLKASLPTFVALLVHHRPKALRGRSLAEVMPLAERSPDQLLAHYRSWRFSPHEMRNAPPSLAFAVLGQARASGRITPEEESRLLGDLITYWALRSTLDTAAVCANQPKWLMPLGQPAIWTRRSPALALR